MDEAASLQDMPTVPELMAIANRRVYITAPYLAFRPEDLEQSIPARFEQQELQAALKAKRACPGPARLPHPS
ncbi:MAG: hypothetical protein HY326_01130 [Chloroflexi bacterium]|nr:hypothetical protein [Chloroflexota bacterium]